MATFVLAHGAFQGGWVWRDVARRLRGAGHEVHTPTFSGCGHLHHGAREGLGLHAYIQDLGDYLQFEGLEDVVLAAHSFSGMVLGGAMMRVPRLIAQAVFVDGVIPEAGRSFADTAGDAFRHMLESHRLGSWKVRPWALPMFGVPEERAAWFKPRLCDFPVAAFLTPFPGEFDPTAVPAAYLSCRNTASPFIRAMALKARGLGWPVAELESGHCPMVTCPDALAAQLDALAEPRKAAA